MHKAVEGTIAPPNEAVWIWEDPPKFKKDWPGRHIRLLEKPPRISRYSEPLKLDEDGGLTVKIKGRDNAKASMHTGWDVSSWGDIRILRCLYICPHCRAGHTVIIPESWIDEGKAVFLTEVRQ